MALVHRVIGGMPRHRRLVPADHAAGIHPQRVHTHKGRLEREIRIGRHGIVLRLGTFHHQHQREQRDGHAEIPRPDAGGGAEAAPEHGLPGGGPLSPSDGLWRRAAGARDGDRAA